MNESLAIRFLYKTGLGRAFLKALVNPVISKGAAFFLSSSFSRIMIPWFIKKNGIDMRFYEIPKGGYKSFNDFFTRRLKKEFLWKKVGEMVSPCDGLLTVSEIDENSVFHIKHTEYSLRELLKSKELAKEYIGGTAFVFRLTPSHFHRYIWTASGCVTDKKQIGGVLHSVRPICHERFRVFVQNAREYTRLTTPSGEEIVQMEIGALLVGKIRNYGVQCGDLVCAGDEKGFFEYGGSSVVILTSKKCMLADELGNRTKIDNEIPVHIGERLIP